MKSEPDEFSIDDLVAAKGQSTSWFGACTNYQARNFMREMEVGDAVLFYHSSCPEPGITGIAQVSRLAHPDVTQFDPKSHYYDPQVAQGRVPVVERRRETGAQDTPHQPRGDAQRSPG